MAREAYPALSAGLLASHLHLDPFPPLSTPVWGFLVRLIGAIFGRHVVGVLNFINVVFAALCLSLLYLIIVKASRQQIIKQNERQRVIEKSNRFSGLVAVGVLAFCPPFWFIATRAHPAAFDLLILMKIFMINFVLIMMI